MQYHVTIDGRSYQLELEREGSRWSCQLDGRKVEVDVVVVQTDVLSIRTGNEVYEAKREAGPSGTQIWVGSETFATEVRDPRSLRDRERVVDVDGPKRLIAPMPGRIVRVLLAEGAPVEAGDGVIVVEAMKMQNAIKSPKSGKVQKILVAEGTAVNAGDVLAIVE